MHPTFRQLCNNDPAVAIKALIDSLNNQQRIPWLKLRYTTFRDVQNDICYGCGATYTVLNLLSPKSLIESIDPNIFDNEMQLVKYLECNYKDLHEFENAIDRFRIGFVDRLATYFDTELPDPIKDWYLEDNRPLEDLPLIQCYYDQLQYSRNNYQVDLSQTIR